MKLQIIVLIAVSILFSGCFSVKTDAFLLGAGLGAGAACMAMRGDPLCRAGQSSKPLWMVEDSRFPDASIPYDMDL